MRLSTIRHGAIGTYVDSLAETSTTAGAFAAWTTGGGRCMSDRAAGITSR